MAEARSRGPMKWGLLVSGVLGLLCAVSMLLGTIVQTGHSTTALDLLDHIPLWAQWVAAPPSHIPMLVVGAVCALLLVAGPWPVRVVAAVAAAWFAYAQAAYAPGSRLAQQAAQTFEYTPFWVAGLVGVAALAAVSVLAAVVAVRPARAAEASRSIAAESRP